MTPVIIPKHTMAMIQFRGLCDVIMVCGKIGMRPRTIPDPIRPAAKTPSADTKSPARIPVKTAASTQPAMRICTPTPLSPVRVRITKDVTNMEDTRKIVLKRWGRCLVRTAKRRIAL